jgi:hypothetical protein
VEVLCGLVRTLDCLTGRHSRLIVIVDGLDSVEQRKVLQLLDTVRTLFTEPGSPFIILLAIDPHVITKAIELDLNAVFADTSIDGFTYLRNMVHLPFFLQSAGRWRIEQARAAGRVEGGRREATESGPGEVNRMLLTDDYFGDVTPRSMRRLMNIIYVTGRLLKVPLPSSALLPRPSASTSTGTSWPAGSPSRSSGPTGPAGWPPTPRAGRNGWRAAWRWRRCGPRRSASSPAGERRPSGRAGTGTSRSLRCSCTCTGRCIAAGTSDLLSTSQEEPDHQQPENLPALLDKPGSLHQAGHLLSLVRSVRPVSDQ